MALRVALIALLAAAFQSASRPATLQGHVVRAGTVAAVAHARVVVARVGGTLADYRTLTTGADGRFTVPDLAPGSYRIYATHDGYLRGELGRRPAGTIGVPVALVEAETSPDLEIALTPTGVIAGHVVLNGEPVRNSIVRALTSTYLDGERHVGVADWAQTDDRGEYRLFGLAPGRYLVSAAAPARPRIEGGSLVTSAIPSNANGNSPTDRTPLTPQSITAAAFDRAAYPAVYHPGTYDAAAAGSIDLHAGETVLGIDLVLAPARTVHLRGRVIVADAPTNASVRIALETGDLSYALASATVYTDATGAFDVAGVLPGRYYLSVQTTNEQGGGQALYDVVPADVGDSEAPPMTITLERGVTVSGHVSVDGGGIVPGRPPILVQLHGVSARGSCCGGVTVRPDGTFRMENVRLHEYRLSVRQAGATFWVTSARFGPDDFAAGPVRIAGESKGRELEIALDTHTATADALVVDRDEHPQAGVLVAAVPSGARRGDSAAYRTATTGADGHARVTGLAPGKYTLFASDSIPAAGWQDPDVLSGVENRGTPVEVGASETKSITLRIIQ